jgi:two-component system, NarL family, response regulator NreC
MTRLLIIDDHEFVRDALAFLLDNTPGFEVVGVASSIRAGSALLMSLSPDVVVADMSLDDGNATELMRVVRRQQLPSRILVLTGFDDPAAVSEPLREGAAGLVHKSQAAADLVEAIKVVAGGGHYMPPSLCHLQSVPAPSTRLGNLSRRENEIFRLVLKGWAHKQIASRLFISTKTVESHRTNINRKLGVRTVPDLIRLAAAEGIAIAPRTGAATQGYSERVDALRRPAPA